MKFKIKNAKETLFIITALATMVTLVILISLVGKNLTYTTRFTPPSTQQSLKNQSYFTQSQVLIVAIGGLLFLVIPSLTYTIFLKSKRLFIPLWATFICLSVFLLLLSIYYLAGSSNYRDYLSQLTTNIDNTPQYCQKSMCNKVTCARLSSYHSSRYMATAFCIIGSLSSIYIAGIGFYINLGRRKHNQIELIM